MNDDEYNDDEYNDDEYNEDSIRWCYMDGPYSLEGLGNDAWLTGCPLCGDNCWEKVTPKQKAEAEEYWRENEKI